MPPVLPLKPDTPRCIEHGTWAHHFSHPLLRTHLLVLHTWRPSVWQLAWRSHVCCSLPYKSRALWMLFLSLWCIRIVIGNVNAGVTRVQCCVGRDEFLEYNECNNLLLSFWPEANVPENHFHELWFPGCNSDLDSLSTWLTRTITAVLYMCSPSSKNDSHFLGSAGGVGSFLCAKQVPATRSVCERPW